MKIRIPPALVKLFQLAFGIIVLLGFYWLSHFRYTIFHVVAELFSTTVGIAVFLVAWNTRKIAKNNFFLFVGISLFFTSILTTVHMMSYKGMGIIPGIHESNVATQLWIAKQYLLGLTLLIASYITWRNRPFNVGLTFFLFGSAIAFTLLSIFVWNIFPACFIDGIGLTPFKKISEYVISALFVGAIALLNNKRPKMDRQVKHLLMVSYGILIVSELSFVLYTDVYGIMNFAGHILNLVAFIILYQAIIVHALERPFEFLFAELSRSNASLKQAVAQEAAAEAKVTEERDRADTYLQGMGEGVVVIDRDWKILLWNTMAAHITGNAKQDVCGSDMRSALPLIDEQNRKEYFSFIADAMVSAKTRQSFGNILLKTKDGEEIPVVCSASPLLTKNGSEKGIVNGAIVSFRDSSREREAGRLRSDFAYASHQLRTPISKAILLLQMALEEKDPEKLRANAQESYDALRSIGTLSEQLVVVSKIDQGMIIPTIEAISLSDFVQTLLKAAQPEAAEHKTTIAPEISAKKIVTFYTSQDLLQQALLEILRNAIVYGETGGEVKLKISEQNDALLFEVYNRGIGIDNQHQALAFTKFFRGNNFDTSKIPGTGLGLYIAKEYVRLLKGKIWFKSEPGKDTSFFVSVPLRYETNGDPFKE